MLSRNNLLENREMQLDDGRFIMSSRKYDQLGPEVDRSSIVRAHPGKCDSLKP